MTTLGELPMFTKSSERQHFYQLSLALCRAWSRHGIISDCMARAVSRLGLVGWVAGALMAVSAPASAESAVSAELEYWTTAEPGDEGMVHARRVGERTEAWVVDVNELLPGGSERLDQVGVRLLGDGLYVGGGEHVLELDPRTGELRDSWDMPWEIFGVPGPPDPDPDPVDKKGRDKDGCECALGSRSAPSGAALWFGALATAALARRRR
jgi:hypothetical protein